MVSEVDLKDYKSMLSVLLLVIFQFLLKTSNACDNILMNSWTHSHELLHVQELQNPNQNVLNQIVQLDDQFIVAGLAIFQLVPFLLFWRLRAVFALLLLPKYMTHE